jgi:hypothetical protein
MSNETPRGDRLLEIIAVLLLGITTVGTASCGYQAAQWNGAQQDLAREASDQQVEGARLFGLATQKLAYDTNFLAQYAQAAEQGDDKLTAFYRTTLVRPDFLPVLDQWETQLRAGQTPTNLFQDTEYLDAQLAEYRQAVDRAAASTVASQQASQTADAYVVTTILLAVALFFAGVTSSFRYRPARAMLILLALGTLAVAASRLAGLPLA